MTRRKESRCKLCFAQLQCHAHHAATDERMRSNKKESQPGATEGQPQQSGRAIQGVGRCTSTRAVAQRLRGST